MPLCQMLLLVVAASLVRADSPPGQEPGFRNLFDGQTLQGWKPIGGKPGNWTAAEGVLVCAGQGGGWLGTDRDYADFLLQLEFRMTPGSNSGVYLRAPADTSHISRTGMEIQLLDETHPSFKNVKPWQLTGAIYHVAAPQPGHLKPTGEWNGLEIRAQGAHIVIKLNGSIVVDDRLDAHPDLEAEHPGLKRKEGRIGLQSHNGRVEFRGIRLKIEDPAAR